MLSGMIRRLSQALVVTCGAIASAPCMLAGEQPPGGGAYAIHLLGSEDCGATVLLTAVYLRTPGLEDRLKRMGVRPVQIRSPGVTADPTPIPADVLDVGASYYGLQEQDGTLVPSPTSKLAFKDPATSLVAPYYFMDLGDVGLLSFENYNKTNGLLAPPWGFGLLLRRAGMRWEPSVLNSKDAPGLLSCMGYRLTTRTPPSVPDAADVIAIVYEGGAFVPSRSLPDGRAPHFEVTIAGLHLIEHPGRTGSMSQAVASVDGVPALVGWLKDLSTLLENAEASRPVGWVQQYRAAAATQHVETGVKQWSFLPVLGALTEAPVWVRAILAAKPVSVVYFQSTAGANGAFVYVLNDAAGKPSALVEPEGTKLQPEFALFELAARPVIAMDPAGSHP